MMDGMEWMEARPEKQVLKLSHPSPPSLFPLGFAGFLSLKKPRNIDRAVKMAL